MGKLTQARLKEVLHYNPTTGVFIWKVNHNNRIKAGDVAGGLSGNGYMQICVDTKRYTAHRLAHLYMEGYFPEHEMDHKLGVRDDNRWSELNHVSHMCNSQNQKRRVDNTSGFTGVAKKRRKWMAYININSKRINIGIYETVLEAALARFTVEVQCPEWSCNYRSELVKAIKEAWPEFRVRE